MGKPRVIGMFKPYSPNNKIDNRRKKTFGHKKGKKK